MHIKGWAHRLITKYLLVFIVIFLWEILPRSGIINPILLPTFSLTIITIKNLFLSGELLVHLSASLKRSLLGFGLALVAGISLGLVIGWYNRIEMYSDLLVQSLRNTSTFALMPIFILLLGIGELSKIAIIFFGAVWPILINTISGVKNVDPLFIKAARSMGVNDRELFRKVILPASVPSIIAGVRLGVKIAIMVVIAAEMIAANSGMGYFIQYARTVIQTDQVYAGVLVMTVLGLAANYFMVWIEKKATYWKGDIDNAIL
ncbi:MAG: ABC transporter permease [Candidatus Methanoperedens sp.]|nr:ABC transporter permease [Candidatus Methanoperedens sp.]